MKVFFSLCAAMFALLSLSSAASGMVKHDPIAATEPPAPIAMNDNWAREKHAAALAPQPAAPVGTQDNWARDRYAAAADARPAPAGLETPVAIADDGTATYVYVMIGIAAAILLGGAALLGNRVLAHRPASLG